MSLLRNITRGLRSLLRKEQVDRELDEELGAYLEMAAAEKMREGMSRKEAVRAVRLERERLPCGSCLPSSFPPPPFPSRRPAPHPTPGRPAPFGAMIGGHV